MKRLTKYFFFIPFVFAVLLQGKILLAQTDSVKQLQIQPDTSIDKKLDEKITQTLQKDIHANVPTHAISLENPLQKLSSGDSANQSSPLNISKLKQKSKKGFGQLLMFPIKSVENTFNSLNQNSFHGNISAGYDYGVVPFVSNGPIPSGYKRVEGSMNLKIFSFPVNAGFFYSDIRNVTASQNYFRIVYDAVKFKQELNDKINAQTDGIKSKINTLYSEKQQAEQKLYQLKSMSLTDADIKEPDLFSGLSAEKMGALQNLSGDLSFDKIKAPPADFKELEKMSAALDKYRDSIAKTGNVSDTLAGALEYVKDAYNKSSGKLRSAKARSDSIKSEIKKYEEKVKEYETKIKEYGTKLESLKDPKNLLNHTKTDNRRLNNVMNFFSNVKKLEIGLCYPSYSTFLVNGIGVKGVNIEYQRKDLFIAFTRGNTVNNMLFTTNAVQNRLANMQNLFNFFDFNYSRDSRSITAAKFGYGKKEDTHLYFGLLYGLGMPNYLSNSLVPADFTQRVVPDKNFVVEIDGKYIIDKNSSVELVYGRSSLQTNTQYLNEGGLNSLFNDIQSNAAMGKYNLLLPKTRTKITLTARWIDPFFKSYGVGFMRSNNFRAEAKAEQQLSTKLKFTASYRRDEDNLLSLYNYKILLQTIGSTITYNVKKSVTLRLGFNPVIQHVSTKDNSYSLRNVNSITNVLLSYNPMLTRGKIMFNFMYSYFHLTTGTQTNTFENITITNLAEFHKSFRNNFTAGWFRTIGNDSLNNKTWLITDQLSYTIKNGLIVTGGLKAAHNPSSAWKYGYLVKATLPIVKHLSFELSAEKLVPGDFYNSLNFAQINKFPYYCNAKLLLSW